MTRKQLSKALDEIYAGPPENFIEARDALARRLRAEGDREAEIVKGLRKPSKAAGVVNALALSEPEPVERYLGLAEQLREATSGKVDAQRMRSLAREEGELLEELVATAAELGDGASASTLDRVRETLQAAQVDSGLRDRVLGGRVEREERAASVGLENLVAAPIAAKRRSKPKADGEGKESSRRAAAAARKRRAAAKAELESARHEAKEAARQAARAESALSKAKRAQERAEAKVERAASKLEKLP